MELPELRHQELADAAPLGAERPVLQVQRRMEQAELPVRRKERVAPGTPEPFCGQEAAPEPAAGKLGWSQTWVKAAAEGRRSAESEPSRAWQGREALLARSESAKWPHEAESHLGGHAR